MEGTGGDIGTATVTNNRRFAVLLGEFRRSTVLVPVDPGGDAVWSVEFGGVQWIYAFSGERALARFEPAARGSCDRLPVLGARLLDVAVPAIDGPAGVVLDVAGPHPVLFPPVAGIVPESAALTAEQGGAERR